MGYKVKISKMMEANVLNKPQVLAEYSFEYHEIGRDCRTAECRRFFGYSLRIVKVAKSRMARFAERVELNVIRILVTKPVKGIATC